MLQRRDLAKDFSAIVQQEIKNHDDAVLALNMAMGKFRSDLEELEAKGAKDLADLETKLVYRDIALEKVHVKEKEQLDLAVRKMGDLAQEFKGSKEKFEDDLADLRSLIVQRQEFLELKEEFWQMMSNVKTTIAHMKDKMAMDISRMDSNFQNSLNALRDEIASKPSEALQVRKDLTDRLDAMTVNSVGYTRELEVCKKRTFIAEKNIENIYTQIDIIKDGHP